MPLSTGDKLGPYEILSAIGAGGMGEVYKARDTRLDRTVAIKVLPEHIASREDLRARFEREARAIASLNHPSICSLFDIGSGYMVMELIDGETLAARIEKGPLPLDQALKFAAQLADALDRAHRAGVTHRDVKPQNIMLTRDGVKVLDFGLAKSVSNSGPAEETLTKVLTTEGTVLGTPQYMAPEQFEGKEADARSDVWAFGAVLYEMVTGRKAFQGKSYTSLVGAILASEPAPMAVKPFAPAWLERLVRRCLAKDPEDRWQSMRDIVIELQTPPQEAAAVAPAKASRWFRVGAAWAGAATLALIVAGAGWYTATRPAPLRPLVRLDVDLGADVSLPLIAETYSFGGSNVAISPDGARLVFASGVKSGSANKLFTRRLDQSTVAELPGTEGAYVPFFSPDGQWIGFKTGTGRLSKTPVEGGVVVPLGEPGTFASAEWGEDGSIILGVADKGLVRIRDDGGGGQETIAPLGNGDARFLFPQILPGSKAILFAAYTAPNPDASNVEVMTLADHHRKVLARGTSPRYLATSSGAGYLVYLNKGTLFAIPFDPDRLETHGTAVPVLDDIAFNGTYGTAQVSFSRTGTLVYRRGGGAVEPVTVAWLDGAGKTQPLLAKPGIYNHPRLSPDGRRLALDVSDGATDIWVYDWPRDTMTRLTFDGKSMSPVWTPDGRYIVFRATGTGISATRSDGAGTPRLLTEGRDPQTPWSFSPDGKRLVYSERDSKSPNSHLWTVPVESDGAGLRAGKPEGFAPASFSQGTAAFSPDGRWLAYSSYESGAAQVYVRAFPDNSGKWQVSNTGGSYSPMWSRSDLFFVTPDRHIMAAAYTVKADSFVAGKPRLLFEQQIGGSGAFFASVDLAPDGKRMVAVMHASEAKGPPEGQNHVVFLENFFDELRRKVPVGSSVTSR